MIRKGKFCSACQKDEENDMSSHCCGREFSIWNNSFYEMKINSPAINIEEVKRRRFNIFNGIELDNKRKLSTFQLIKKFICNLFGWNE
jgi:hypothetical protein